MILAFRIAHLAEGTRYYAKAIAGARQCECLGTYFCKGLDIYGPFKLIGGIARGHLNREEISRTVLF